MNQKKLRGPKKLYKVWYRLKGISIFTKTYFSNKDTVINVLAYFHVYPNGSIRSAADTLGTTSNSVYRILKHHGMQFQCWRICYKSVLLWNSVHALSWEPTVFIKNYLYWRSKIFWRCIFNRTCEHFWYIDNPHETWHKFNLNALGLLKNYKESFFIYLEQLNAAQHLEIL